MLEADSNDCPRGVDCAQPKVEQMNQSFIVEAREKGHNKCIEDEKAQSSG